MPSFDIVSRIEAQELNNVVNNTLKEVRTRYDFRNSQTEVTFEKSEDRIHLVTDDDMKMEALKDMLIGNCTKRKVNPKHLQFKDSEPTSKGKVKRDVVIQTGIEKKLAQKIVKQIKEMKLKVQAAIQGEEVRVTAKKIDDLQAVIKMLDESDVEVPLQYVNMQR